MSFTEDRVPVNHPMIGQWVEITLWGEFISGTVTGIDDNQVTLVDVNLDTEIAPWQGVTHLEVV